MTDVMVELRAANPAPADAEPHPTAWSDAALLAEIDTRSGTDMSLDQKPKTERAQRVRGPRRWSSTLAAAAAFAAVVLVVATVVLLRDGGGPIHDTTVPPATQPTTTAAEPTTTDLPPTTTEAAVPTTPPFSEVPLETQALLDEYITVYNSGNVAAWVALHAPGTVRVATWNDDTWSSDLEEQAEIYDFFHGIGQTMELVDCEVSAATGIAWCKAFRTDDLTRAAEIEDFTSLGFRFAEGKIVEWRENFVGANLYVSAMGEFGQWMSDTYPSEPRLVNAQGLDFIYTPENADRARRFLLLWKESRDAADG